MRAGVYSRRFLTRYTSLGSPALRWSLRIFSGSGKRVLLPVKPHDSAGGIGTLVRVVLFVLNPEKSAVIDSPVVAETFSLTRRESELAALLASGRQAHPDDGFASSPEPISGNRAQSPLPSPHSRGCERRGPRLRTPSHRHQWMVARRKLVSEGSEVRRASTIDNARDVGSLRKNNETGPFFKADVSLVHARLVTGLGVELPGAIAARERQGAIPFCKADMWTSTVFQRMWATLWAWRYDAGASISN